MCSGSFGVRAAVDRRVNKVVIIIIVDNDVLDLAGRLSALRTSECDAWWSKSLS